MDCVEYPEAALYAGKIIQAICGAFGGSPPSLAEVLYPLDKLEVLSDTPRPPMAPEAVEAMMSRLRG